MRYDLTAPCPGCPFLTGADPNDKPVRLRPGRVLELHRAMATNPGAEFACHKTVRWEETDDGEPIEAQDGRQQHCAGALLYMFHVNPQWTQMARIAMRLGRFNPDALRGEDRVFRSLVAFRKSARP